MSALLIINFHDGSNHQSSGCDMEQGWELRTIMDEEDEKDVEEKNESRGLVLREEEEETNNEGQGRRRRTRKTSMKTSWRNRHV